MWRITDGKAGHEKQTLGLANAVMRITPAATHSLRVSPSWKHAWHWLVGAFPEGAGLPAPDLILAAGHATHFPLLAARRAHGGRSVVLMKPSLPAACFDLCLIPEHDRPSRSANVVATRGALNSVVPGDRHDPGIGLILVGGPSPHFRWDDEAIRLQITRLIQDRPDVHWTLTTSRRTPADFLAGLGDRKITLVPGEDTPTGWLEQRLDQAGSAWVTPDSVSMVYEALTAGCRVGLFELPAVAGSRVAQGVLGLLAEGRLAGPGQPVVDARPAQSFDEATRCAALILDRWFR
jgi:mitochondrial fission protein ELM1